MNRSDKEAISFIATRNSGGGASRIVRQLANGLSSNNINVNLNYIAEEKLSNVSSWPTINDDVTVNLSGKKRSLLSIPWLISQNRNGKGAIICFGRTAAVSLILSSLFFKHKRDIYIWEGKSLSDAQKGAKGIVGKFIIPLLIKLTYKKAKLLIGISNEEVEDFQRYLSIDNSKVTKIYTPAITNQHHIKVNEPLPSWYGSLTKGKLVITAAGSFIPQKNFSLLIKAIEKLRNKYPDIMLILMGDGPEKDKLEKLASNLNIKERVKFTGYMDNPLPIIANGDCFVLSSNWEGLPGVLIEAVFCETRIVATNCPSGPFEILQGGKYGYLSEPNDSSDLADKIALALSNSLPEGLRKHSELFSEEIIIKQYLEKIK